MTFTPTKEMLDAAIQLLTAMAWAQTVRPIVTKYQTEILAEGKWAVREDFSPRVGSGVITEPKDSYLMSDTDFAEYDRRCDEGRKKAGLSIHREGNCPLLEAEANVIQLQRKLLEAMATLPSLKNLASPYLVLDQRKKAVELSLQMLTPFIADQMKHALSPAAVSAT